LGWWRELNPQFLISQVNCFAYLSYTAHNSTKKTSRSLTTNSKIELMIKEREVNIYAK
jgi:hypothetical protein